MSGQIQRFNNAKERHVMSHSMLDSATVFSGAPLGVRLVDGQLQHLQ